MSPDGPIAYPDTQRDDVVVASLASDTEARLVANLQ